MIEAALEYAIDPKAKLFASHAEAPGLRKIERLIKPASFSIANPGTPSPGPRNKRPRLMNLNVSPEYTPGRGGDHRARGSGRGGHRGGRRSYNRNFRPTMHSTPGPNDAFVFSSSSRRASPTTRPALNIEYLVQASNTHMQKVTPNIDGKSQLGRDPDNITLWSSSCTKPITCTYLLMVKG